VNLGLLAFDFWASLPSAGALAGVIAAGRDPALGFASCRVMGTCFVHPSGHVPEPDHPPPHRLRLVHALSSAIRSWALVILPEPRDTSADSTDPRPMPVVADHRRHRPFSVFERLMPCRAERTQRPPGRGSLSEVLHHP